MDSDLEPWMLELLKTIEAEDKGELEEAYGVEFDSDSLPLSCRIITSFFEADFKDASNHHKERLLKEHIVRVLDAACRRVTSNLHKVIEEDGLDIEYLLHRACVELAAIRKEKEHACSKHWIHRVRKEYDDLMDTWGQFKKKWKPLLLSRSQTREEELGMLKQGHEELVSYLQDEKAVKEVEVSSRMFEKLNDLRAKIEISINKELKQILTVEQNEIVAAARKILRIPALWLSNKLFKPNYQELETILARRLFRQDHAIRAITNALSGPHSGKGSIRSFLFICGSKSGGEELTKALAEQLFHDEERLIEFDLANYTEDDSVRQIKFELSDHTELSSDKKCGFRGELIDAVKKMTGTVILLRNVDQAHASVIDFLLEILRNGKVADEKGKMINFTTTLIIMASNLYANFNMLRHWKCDCALMTGKLFLKEEKEDHNHCYLTAWKDAKQHFKPELLDMIDNMIVFQRLIHSDLRVFTRLQLRILANSIGRGRIIVYPSESALNLIAPLTELDYEYIKAYLEHCVVPQLLEICNQSRKVRSIIYIDTLVGTSELSYRVEMGGCFTGDEELEQFLAYDLCQFLNIYEREILWLRSINGLRKTLQLIDGIKSNGDPLPLERLAYKIRNLLTCENGVNSHPRSLQMVLSSSAKLGRSDHNQLKKRAKKEIEDLQKKLFTRSVTDHYVFSTVAKAILNCIKPKISANNNSHAMTALLLGLTTAGRANLRMDLTKLIDDENNGTTKRLLQINLSRCSDYDKFFKLIYAGHKQHSLGYPETVGMRPGSVLLIDQVEKAPISVFSGLISLLDHRMLTDNRGCMIDLSDTIIIIVSNLGNRDFIFEMFEQAPEREKKLASFMDDLNTSSKWQQLDISVWEEYWKKPQRSRFRSELLNRVDEIVFFNPCVGKQLTSFARLSMKDGPHLKTKSPPGVLSSALKDLFDESNFKWEPLLQVRVACSVELLSTGLLPQTSKV